MGKPEQTLKSEITRLARKQVDFSDTSERLHILGLGEVGSDEFRRRYLDKKD